MVAGLAAAGVATVGGAGLTVSGTVLVVNRENRSRRDVAVLNVNGSEPTKPLEGVRRSPLRAAFIAEGDPPKSRTSLPLMVPLMKVMPLVVGRVRVPLGTLKATAAEKALASSWLLLPEEKVSATFSV